MLNMHSTIPENMGVSSDSIYRFINRLTKNKLPMHSILLARHGQLIEQVYYEPYKSDTIHRLYSVSKSFACYGLGGQLAICLPKQDLICITTADTTKIKGGNQFIYDSLYEEILPCLL